MPPNLQAEPDCPHWTPSALDPEPEMCWCPQCGEALPCSTCALPAFRQESSCLAYTVEVGDS